MKTHTITLTYDPNGQTLTTDAKKMTIQKDDSLTFVSAAGPVRVLMIPGERFSAGEFRTGDAPITINVAGKFRFCCGVTIGPEVIGYPLHQRFGDEPTVGDGGGTTT